MNKKIIVITGISSGTGKAFVLNNVRRTGVVIVGMGRNSISDFKEKNFVFIKTDLSSTKSIQHSFSVLKRDFERVDVLINNAGFAYRSTIEDLTPREIKDQFEVNLIGPIYLTSLLVSMMRKQKSGHIINISSVGSVVSTPTLGYYAATKAGFNKLCDVLEQEVNRYNVKVSNLFLGAVKSDFGKNIKYPQNYLKTDYKTLYEEWKKRFSNFFNLKNSPDEVSDALWDLILKPKRAKYIHIRDFIMCTAKNLLPYRVFQVLFLGYFYKYES